MPIKENCFAYDNNRKRCHALKELDCTSCHFYKNKKEIVDNPFYKYSWKNEYKIQRIIKKYKIAKNKILD